MNAQSFQLVAIITATMSVVMLSGCNRNPDENASPDVDADSTNRSSVVMYCSVDQEYAEAIIAEFEIAYPHIDVRPRFDTETTKTTGLVQRLRSEKENPQADLFWSSEVFLTIRLAEEGLLQPFESDSTTNWPAAYRDSNRRWYAFAGRARVIAYNPERVDDPPSSWKDMVDPEYKGRIVMADPVFGTTRGHVATWYHLWGADRAESFLEALVDNGLRVVASNSQTVREVVQGSADFAITDTDDVWAFQRNGYDLAVVYPIHGEGQGTLLIPNTLAFIAGREQDEAVTTMAEFILSEKIESMLYASDSHNVPIVHDIEIDPKYRVPDPLVVDFEDVASTMREAIDSAVRILQGG
jgi:iron(III) transport system substrate-binding protein